MDFGKAAERRLIFVGGAGAGVHDVESAGILFRRIHVAAQAERCRGEREHTRELSAAENSDGGSGLQQGSVFWPPGDGFGLARAPGIEPLGDFRVRQGNHRGGEQRGVGCTRLADHQRTDGNSARHLQDREQ